MTPEEEEIRKKLNLKDEDILRIPADAMWELCRQFNSFVDIKPFPTYLGDYFFQFYCNRVRELAMRTAKVRVTLNDRMEMERQEFDREEAIASVKPGSK